jgi:nitrogen regulatory protein PII-like uncharacterized protein
MSYREENGQVILAMSREDYERVFSQLLDDVSAAAMVTTLSYEEVISLVRKRLEKGR